MYISKKYVIYLIICTLVGSLFAGCSRPIVPLYSSNENSVNNSKNKETIKDTSALESWIGDYTFSEFAPPDQNMFYRFSIYKENDNYYAEISVDGFQTVERLHAKVIGDEKSIKLVFDKYLPDNVFEPYKQGDILFGFEKKNLKLYTFWEKIQPMLESNMKSGEVYFKIES